MNTYKTANSPEKHFLMLLSKNIFENVYIYLLENCKGQFV